MTKFYFSFFLTVISNLFLLQAKEISGYILDENEEPVESASVSFSGTSIGTHTDEKGYFSLAADKQKNVTLCVNCLGYEDFSKELNLSDKNDNITVLLNQKQNYLNTVVVTGTLTRRTLKDSPVLTKVISSKELREMGAVTALDALENLMPGVHFDPNPMGDNIQIQGLGNKYILILVDGERLVNERTEGINFARLNTADIKQIEIINGAASVLYGSNAIGAVINIITKDVNKPVEGMAAARYSKYDTFNADASLGLKFGDFSSKTTFNTKSSDGYSVTSDGYTRTVDPYSDYTIGQTFRYKIKDKIDVKVNGRYYRNELWFLKKFQTRVDENYNYGGQLNYVFSDKNVLTFSGNHDSYEGNTVYKRMADSTEFNNDSKNTTLRLVDIWSVNDKIQWVNGAEYNYESTFSYNQFGDPGSENARSGDFFSQGEFKTETGLEAVIGLRYTHHSEFGGHVSPKISLMYKYSDFCFRGGLSNGYKTPTVKEMYMNFPHKIGDQISFYVIGNPNLIPEESWYQFISAEYITPNINASVTVYKNNIQNKINTIEVENKALERWEMRYENVDDAEIYGVDAFAQVNLWKCLYVKTGYAYANAKDKNTGLQLAGNSKHNATLSFTLREYLPFQNKTRFPFSLMLSGRLSSPRIYDEISVDDSENEIVTESRSDTYFTCRAVYSQTFPIYKSLVGDIQLGVDNLFDYVNTDVSVNPGRTFFVSAGFRF